MIKEVLLDSEKERIVKFLDTFSLKYEDDIYSEERKNFPELGSRLFIDKVEYVVTGVNIISKVIKIEGDEDIKFMPADELMKVARWKKRKEYEEKKEL